MNDARRSQASKARSAARARDDTIVAAATAPGRGAIAVIRVSGADTERIGRAVLAPWPSRPRALRRCAVHEPGRAGRRIDEALAVTFAAPGSYTGESMLEVHSHGGSYIPAAIVAALVSAGARPAEPGEFTERAVLNGKLDIVRAEAIGELIDARTRAAHRSALSALSGTLTRQYEALRAQTVELEALLAYEIDFPGEDDGPVARERIEGAATTLSARLKELCDTAPTATLARDGALVVLAGPPNAGKSSLLNALVGEARVIVSEEPGTTRDAVEVLLDGDPWPLRVVDTAGLRNDPGTIERLGIEVSDRYLGNADIVLVCAENEDGLREAQDRVKRVSGGRIVLVRTKSDLPSQAGATGQGAHVAVSARTGDGLADLLARLMREVSEGAGVEAEHSAIVSSARQRAALTNARGEVDAFVEAWRARELPAPLAATHLRAAATALNGLIGVIDSDDVLERVFSTFCVGK